MPLDPLTDFDWAAHWRELVEIREKEVPIDPNQDFWASMAPRLKYDPAEVATDPLLKVMEPYLDARKTGIDAGAGAGRHAVPLAERLDWVTAVEPSEGMRAAIPHRDNLTVVASSWEEAEVAPADLVVCAHVLYFVADPVPFVEKLNRSAKERVFVFMRDREMVAPSEQLYPALTGRRRTRMPQLYDFWNLLRCLDVNADLATVSYEIEQVYQDLDEVLDECRHRLGTIWREDDARNWLEAHMIPREDGRLGYSGTTTAGIAHWRP